MPDTKISTMTDGGDALAADRLEIARETAPGVWGTFSLAVAKIAALANALLTVGASNTYDTFAKVEARIGERELKGGAWTPWVPVVSATTPAGSGFAATVSFARYEKRGRTVHLQFLISITNLGAGPAASGNITVTLPVNAANASICTGGEYGITSRGAHGSVSAGSNLLSLRLADGTATAVLNYQFRVSMTYEAVA